MGNDGTPIGEYERAQEFDLNSADIWQDPFPVYDMLRGMCPVVQSNQVGWVVSGYEDVRRVTRDFARFRSDWGAKNPGPARTPRTREPEDRAVRPFFPFPLLPIEVDPPDHAEYRKILGPMFTATAIADDWGDQVRQIARDLVGPLVAATEWEAVQQLSWPMSGYALSAVAGIPTANRTEFQELVQDMDGNMSQIVDFVDAQISRAEMGAFAELRRGVVRGRSMTRDEKLGYGVVLVIAGWETTAASISDMVYRLGTDSKLRDELAEHPENWDSAVEEFLRIDAPVHALWRTAGEDTEVRGCPVRTGDKVLPLWASANRDPQQFPDPDKFVAGRRPNRHLAFGVGAHYCLGAHLARLELRVLLEELLTRMPRFEIRNPSTVRWIIPDGSIRRISSLPVTNPTGKE